MRPEYQIREMESVGKQIYGKLLYVTKNFDDALDHLLSIQKRDTRRKVGLLIANGDNHGQMRVSKNFD